MSWLGIDVGTSALKAAVMDQEGFRMLSVDVPGASESLVTGELDPVHWWTALIEVMAGFSREERNAVEGIAMIGNTPTLVFLDERGEVTYPALLWHDTRAHLEATELLQERSQQDWDNIFGGHIPMTGGYPSAKLRWMHKHRPDVLQKTYAVIQPKDYLNYRLAGVVAGDPWTSKGIVSLRPGPFPDPLTAIGLSNHMAPRCLEPNRCIGSVATQAAEALGIPLATPVYTGWSDTLGAVLSLRLAEKDAFILSGTSSSIGVVLRHQDIQSAGVLAAPIWDTGLEIVYGPTATGMSTMHWAVNALGFGSAEPFYEAASAQQTGDASPYFVPYLAGQRSPLWNDTVRGMWAGLDIAHTRGELALAAAEGVVWSEYSVLAAVEQATASVAQSVVVTGGGAHLPLMNQLRQAMTGRPTLVADSEPVVGAALLAFWGAHPDRYPSGPDQAKIHRLPVEDVRHVSDLRRARYAQLSLLAEKFYEGR